MKHPVSVDLKIAALKISKKPLKTSVLEFNIENSHFTKILQSIWIP